MCIRDRFYAFHVSAKAALRYPLQFSSRLLVDAYYLTLVWNPIIFNRLYIGDSYGLEISFTLGDLLSESQVVVNEKRYCVGFY